jgi:replicative DNA helicase
MTTLFDYAPELTLYSAEAEAGVIGTILYDNNVWDSVADLITDESFFRARHKDVFAAMGALINAGKQADVITTFSQLQLMNKAEGTDLSDILALSHAAPSARNARQYAATVADHALARRLKLAADQVQEIAGDAATAVLDRVGQAQAVLEAIEARKGANQPKPIEEFVVGMLDHLQALADGTVQAGIPTRIPTLDRMLGGGLKPKKLMVIAARPSVGKSSIAEQICINLALDGHACAMFSMEMTEQEMTNRAACNIGRINLDHMETGKLEDGEWSRLAEAIERMRAMPLHFLFQPAMTLQDIASRARVLKRKHGIKVLVVDYLQLCGSANQKDSRHHQIETLSRGLKTLAGQLDLTIIELSQFSREVEKRVSGRPQLSDLKESGAIEEDADVAILMWRHAVHEGHQVIGIDVAKNRQGRTGELAMHFEGKHQRWGESTENLSAEKKPTSRAKYSDDF